MLKTELLISGKSVGTGTDFISESEAVMSFSQGKRSTGHVLRLHRRCRLPPFPPPPLQLPFQLQSTK